MLMHLAAMLPSGEALMFLVPLTAIGGFVMVKVGQKIERVRVIALLLGHYEGGGVRAKGELIKEEGRDSG